MAVIAPGRRPAYPPIGRLRGNPLSGGGKKSMMISLNLTPMVDMFTILVIFLIQLFKAAGQVEMKPDIEVPKTTQGQELKEEGTVVEINNQYMLVNGAAVPADEMGTPLDASIPGLVKILTAQRELRERVEGRDETKSYQGKLLIQADVKTDFAKIRRVIASANEAGWAHFKFISNPAPGSEKGGEGGGEGAAPAAPAAPATPAPAGG